MIGQLHNNIKAASLPIISQIQSPKSKIKLNINLQVTMGNGSIERSSELKEMAENYIPKVEDTPAPQQSRLTVQPVRGRRKIQTARKLMPRPLFLAGQDPMI